MPFPNSRLRQTLLVQVTRHRMAKRHADLIGRAPDDATLAPALVGRQDKFKLIRDADWTCHKQGRPRSCHVSHGAVDCGTLSECDAAALEYSLPRRFSSVLHWSSESESPRMAVVAQQGQ